MQEENVHGLFGMEIVRIVRKENPEFFDEELEDIIKSASKKAYKAEEEIIDWIMDNRDLDFLTRDEIKEFIKNRFDNSLEECGFEKVFDIDVDLLKSTNWIELQLNTSKEDDFFAKRSTSYNKFSKPVNEEELF